MDEELRHERLRAMGVHVWQTRTRATADVVTDVVDEPTAPLEDGADDDSFGPMYDPDTRTPVQDFEEPMTLLPAASSAAQANDTVPDPLIELAVDLQDLRAQVRVCKRCDLHKSRTQTVFGVGNESARLLVIGEAPGADEDAQGEPFVGRAGKLLNAMLMGIGLAREQVYIANILKCRPPRNRDPHVDEVASCAHYLHQQIAFVAPQLILALGRVAAQNLLGVTTPIGKLRGKTHSASGVPVLVTYHPAYLLRSPLEKRRAWQDLKQVAAHLGIMS